MQKKNKDLEIKNLQKFPKDFLWGASSSAFQIEGAWDTDGKGPSILDDENSVLRSLTKKGLADFKVASDHYHHFRDDIKLMAEMGLKSYRFSIAWARIYPDGKTLNPKGIAFYHELIDCLREHSIEPIVTIYHFELPLALEKEGGWLNRDLLVDAYVKYAKTLLQEYGNKVKYWLTMNEQNMFPLFELILSSKTNANQSEVWKKIAIQNHNMFIAGALVMKFCHQNYPHCRIAPVPNIMKVYPYSCRPIDNLAVSNITALFYWGYLDVIVYGRYNNIVWKFLQERNALPEIRDGDFEILSAARPDFIAFNYYGSVTFKDLSTPVETNQNNSAKSSDLIFKVSDICESVTNPYLERTKFEWEIDPIGFRLVFRELWDRYHLPLMVTENGLGSDDVLTSDFKIHDDYRIDYLAKHIEQMQLALSDGVHIIGYNPWSVMDLVSSHNGFSKRYGFIYVNRGETDLRDLKRYKKDSFYWYKELIAKNYE